MNADRNLLFGILAFQLNFIDRQALLAAFDRWTADKNKRLGGIFVEQQAISADECALLEALVGKHLDRHGGNAEKSLAAITPIGSIREELKRLADPDVEASLAHVSIAPVAQTHDTTLTWTAGSSTLAGARFRVLRPHAKGGLGEVFVAHDEELDREVAFKEIQDRHADNPDSRGRFLLEAKVTGGLEHPGIVPVYGLGSYADGRPFYAMRFIKGDSLKEAIHRFHQANAAGQDSTDRTAELRNLLGRFIDVCNAIEYAHSRGVLHRDLKPGNIMLGNFGETLVVDWGLAKVLGRSETPGASNEPAMKTEISSGSAATQMGKALGTPQYMSPEQAAGRWDELGRESDVYSLGATLYTLLTGRAPIGDSESMGALARAVKGDFPAPRTIDKLVPPALDAICQKAMALKPTDRYPSPRALADDIERWLNDQPVSVHRDPFSRKLARWVRNHKGTTGAAAATVAVLVIGGFVASAISRQANERTRVLALADSLMKANVTEIPGLLKELAPHHDIARERLVAAIGAGGPEERPRSIDERRRELHSRLALVSRDPQYVPALLEELLTGDLSYLGILRDQLMPYQRQMQNELWELLHDGTNVASRRFRAGLALAGYAAGSEQWSAADGAFLVEHLVAANPEHQPRLREYLRPIDRRLLDDLERIFADPKMTESHQLGAANALADLAATDSARLAHLLSAATAGQYEILYPLVAEARDSAGRKLLDQLVHEVPTVDLPQLERVALGQRRAGAAITLLRQGERESILDVLRVALDPGGGLRGDPESLTQFVHRCRQRGVLPAQLLDCVQRADALRQSKMGEARWTDDDVLYGLLLSLGQFELAELPEAERDAFVKRLANWYGSDPSSAIHGATGWLLRHWKQDEAVAYCRWLTKSAGMPEDDQAYGDPASLDRARFPADSDPEAGGAPRNWPVNVKKPGFRLATELEWELVCRGGTNTMYSFGNDVRQLSRYGWFSDNSDKWSHAVGQLLPSLRGLFDIHGNLFEWCHDGVDFAGEVGAEEPVSRMARGGGWGADAARCRAAYRFSFRPSYRAYDLGFRVAAVPFSQASDSQASENREAEWRSHSESKGSIRSRGERNRPKSGSRPAKRPWPCSPTSRRRISRSCKAKRPSCPMAPCPADSAGGGRKRPTTGPHKVEFTA